METTRKRESGEKEGDDWGELGGQQAVRR